MKAASVRRASVRLAQRLARLEQRVAVVLLSVVVVALAAQVIARYVFRSPISWSEEVATLSLIWLTFIASGFMTARRGHIAVDVLAQRLGMRSRRWLDRLASWIVLATCLLLLFGGFQFVWRVWPVSSPGIGVSKSYWYGAASVGLALMSFHVAVQLFAEPPWDGRYEGRGRGNPDSSDSKDVA